MTIKLLLIDWDFVSTHTKDWYGFPVHASLVKEWLDSGKYESKAMDLYNNMRASSVFSTLPSDSPVRWLISMLRWFYFKQQNYLGADQYSEGLEDVYSSDPELVEYLYSEYYQFFEKYYTFKANDQIQRLIDRKPDDWRLGIVSLDRTKEEIELILSDRFGSAKEYGKAFVYRFCTDSPIRIYDPAVTSESVEFVFKAINNSKFGDYQEVYILSNPDYREHVHSDSVDIVEVLGDNGIDDFNYSDPYGDLHKLDKEPNKIPYLHTLVMDKFPFMQRVIDFYENEGDLIGGVLIAYSLLVVLISTISEWLGLIDSYSDVIFYALGVPFVLWIVIMLSILVFVIITTVPIDTVNRYYENIDSGLDQHAAMWKALKPNIIWTTILMVAGYSMWYS